MKKTSHTAYPDKDELYEFETFLQAFGFKRTEGALYGFLVLCESPATAEEIGQHLGLSQGAISQGLKNLSQWGGVISRYDSDKGAQVHSAVQDSVKIVASVFKKREQDAIASMKGVAQKTMDRFLKNGDTKTHPRILRLKSIIMTCETAESVINFILSLSTVSDQKKVHTIVKALPKALELLVQESTSSNDIENLVNVFLNPSAKQEKWL